MRSMARSNQSLTTTGPQPPAPASGSESGPGLDRAVGTWWKRPAGVGEGGSVWLGSDLGAGGTGAVWEGRLPGSGQVVAIKTALRLAGRDWDSDPAVLRLRHELEVYEGPLASLQGEFVPQLLAAGTLKVSQPRACIIFGQVAGSCWQTCVH